jgi:hypothetical protein
VKNSKFELGTQQWHHVLLGSAMDQFIVTMQYNGQYPAMKMY